MTTALNRALGTKSLQNIADRTVKDLVSRVRRGFGIKDKIISRLKPLSPSYIKKRRSSRLGPTTSSNKSNLTFTGSMLASIRGIVKSLSIIIGPTGSKNIEKANIVSEKRPFLDLSAKEEAKVVKSIEKSLTKELNKIFK